MQGQTQGRELTGGTCLVWERHGHSLLQNAHRIPHFIASFHQHCRVEGTPHSFTDLEFRACLF